jgi:hypothetical protein
LIAHIPWLWSAMVARELSTIGVAVKWDPRADGADGETRP